MKSFNKTPIHFRAKFFQHRVDQNRPFSCSFLYLAIALCIFATTNLYSQEYEAILSGRQESLPVLTQGTGHISATLTADNTLSLSGKFSGLEGDFNAAIAGGSHIHTAYAGQNGGVALRLNATLSADLRSGEYEEINNTFTLTSEQVDALRAGRLYINIHSTAYPSGELRGQLQSKADAYFFSNLFGSNEVPAIMSGGSGALSLGLHGDQLVVSGAFRNLDGDFDASVAGGAHLHLGYAGTNGGIQIRLKATPDEDLRGGVFEAINNTFTLSPQQIRWLQARQLYANIHTKAFRTGELRGQILGAAKAVFRAHLSGSNEIPAVTTFAHGTVMAELMADNQLIVSGSFADLESKLAFRIAGGAHIHNAMAGSNGRVAYRLASSLNGALNGGSFSASKNSYSLTADQVNTLYQRGNYVNIHTLKNRSGELRGQLLPESQIVFNGYLSSIFTNPSVVSTALGGIKAELMGNKLTLSGSFNGLLDALATNIAGGAHIHEGAPGINGGIAFRLASTLADDQASGKFEAAENTFELDEEQVAHLKRRAYYVNVHSLYSTSGEIRAQLLPDATAYFIAPLSASNQRTPINSAASGLGIVEINGNNGFFSGAFQQLSSPVAVAIAGGAHLHRALAGRNGSIEVFLQPTLGEGADNGTFSAAANVFPLNRSISKLLREHALYVNIHSEQNRGGELRGQLMPLSTAYFTANFSGMNAVQPKASDGFGGFKLALSGNKLSLSGSFDNLSDELATSIAGGSHLHISGPGGNGALNIPLRASLDADRKGAIYTTRKNQYALNEEQLSTLLAGNYYVNIHSSTIRSGEIRGQVLPETNAFPSADASITAPANEANLTIEGDPATSFVAEWSAATDRNALAYIWQLSTDEAFTGILINQNVGNSLSFSTDFASVNGILEAAGLDMGESIKLYHRAIASDGSLFTPGASSSLTLTKGVIHSSALEAFAKPEAETQFKTDWQIKAFPTVNSTGDELTIDIQGSSDEEAQLVLFNQLGQQLKVHRLSINKGLNRTYLPLTGLNSGWYFIQLKTADSWSTVQRIVVK